jgi:trehalose 6-phosphate synthase
MKDGKHQNSSNRLVVVSNRLPVVLSREADGTWTAKPGSGGLITALAPVLRDRGGLWIGWPGAPAGDEIHDALQEAAGGAGYELDPVMLSQEQVDGFYHGFSNETIWPLFHDLPSRSVFASQHWQSYQSANMRFAEKVAATTAPDELVWVHDYQLMLVAAQLQAIGADRLTGFFLHTPFPAVDMFAKLPWRFQVLRALLEYDTVGFQTVRDVRNFVSCVRALVTGVRVSGGRSSFLVELPERQTRVGSFPIGIDYTGFERHARSDDVVREVRRVHDQLPNISILLGVDRLDYTKGLLERLQAYRHALRRYPELQGTVTFMQVVVPSRVDVPEYQELRAQIERLVGEINGEFTQPGWVPIHYLFRALSAAELLAYYRMAEVCVVTPLKDGMNLVSKEYCACNIDEDGVLVLSEFAGSAAQLYRGAIVVNPYDVDGTADALYQAVKMPHGERRTRMRRLRAVVRREDIFWWTDAFLRAAFSKRLDDLPVHEYYVPRMDIRDLAASESDAATPTGV